MTTDNASTLEGLAAKLHSLELTEAEQGALGTILQRAASVDAEVEGFGVVFEVETTFQQPPDIKELQQKLAFGIGVDPQEVWTDMRVHP